MAFLLAQGGSTLYKINPSTGVATALTLPTGVTLSTTRKPRFAVMNQFVAVVNSPTVNLAIDPEGAVRVMCPRSPTSGAVVTSGGVGAITGAIQTKVSFVVLGTDGTLLMESPLSPASVSVSLASNSIALTGIPISFDNVTARRVYRNLSGGTVFYKVLDVDGNVTSTATTNTSDASLQLLPVSVNDLIAPPGTISSSRMRNIVSWKSRLWGVGSDPAQVDTVVFTESNKVYAWPNSVVAYPTGADADGIVAFAPRRDQLGVLKRNGLWQITGSGSGSTGISTASVSLVQVVFGKGGCIAPDTVVTINDRVYWLADDGVWEWGPDGVKNITDETVSPWFKTDTYFNRGRFANAFARYNVQRNQYELHLADVDSEVEDRWVSFNLNLRRWFGPHKTAQFTPSHAILGQDLDGLPLSLVGGTDGTIYVANSILCRDGANAAIDMDCVGPFHSKDGPDIDHYWGQLSVLTKIEDVGTLTITPTVGRFDSTAQDAIEHDLTKGRERMRRLGEGAMVKLQFQQNVIDQGAVIYGYEIAPVHETGRH